MSLSYKVQKAVEKMFETLKDFQSTASYEKKTNGEFDPDTGTISVTSAVIPIKGVALNYQEYIGSDKSGERSDIAFVYLYTKYPVFPVVGEFVTVDSKIYSIISFEQDPARITYSLQLRAA